MTRIRQSRRGGLACAVIVLTFPLVCAGQESDGLKFSAGALRTAQIIGAEPLLSKLASVRSARDRSATGIPTEELALHQEITEALMAASLDVDFVLDQIDNERAQIVELQSIILERKQRAIGTTSLATLALSTGLGAVSGLLQFSETTRGAGNAIGFAAGGISTLLSFHSLRQQHSGARPEWVFPSMLSPFFAGPPSNDAYPADTWTWLNSAPQGGDSTMTRKERLLAAWRRAGRYPALDSPQSETRIALLTATDASDKKLTIGLLAERAAMLADVRDEVSALKRSLAEILGGIRASR